jgi:hypothetical protein
LLFLVPFAALLTPNNQSLIDQHTLVYAPSIQLLALTQQQRQRFQGAAPHTALVVGNPTMPSLPSQGNSPPTPLESLPGAAEEALAVAALLNTQALTGHRATKAAVVRLMPQQRFIHLATHGLLDLDAHFNALGEPLDPTARTARESHVLVTPGAVLVGANVDARGVPAEVALAREQVVLVSMPGAIALAPSPGDNGWLTAKETTSR